MLDRYPVGYSLIFSGLSFLLSQHFTSTLERTLNRVGVLWMAIQAPFLLSLPYGHYL
jgi:hypothetical protein